MVCLARSQILLISMAVNCRLKLSQARKRVIENDDCLAEVRVRVALRQKQRQCENRLVPGAECVSKARRTGCIPARSG